MISKAPYQPLLTGPESWGEQHTMLASLTDMSVISYRSAAPLTALWSSRQHLKAAIS